MLPWALQMIYSFFGEMWISRNSSRLFRPHIHYSLSLQKKKNKNNDLALFNPPFFASFPSVSLCPVRWYSQYRLFLIPTFHAITMSLTDYESRELKRIFEAFKAATANEGERWASMNELQDLRQKANYRITEAMEMIRGHGGFQSWSSSEFGESHRPFQWLVPLHGREFEWADWWL